MEIYIDSSDSEFGRAEAGEAAGEVESRGQSPNPSKNVVADHPKGTRSATRKRRVLSLPGNNR